MTALPDVAAQTGPSSSDAATPPTPPASVCSSAPEDEPSKNVVIAPVDNKVVVACEEESKTDVASYFVDNDNVEIVVSEKAYGHRDESTLPPVTIFCKGETPLEDWTSNGDFIFGYPVNEELVSMSLMQARFFDEMTSQTLTEEDDDDGLNSASAVAATTSLTLNQEDNAIVSFGESLDDLKVTVSPESGICIGVCGRQQQHLDRSGRSTPQYLDSGASSWADQVYIFYNYFMFEVYQTRLVKVLLIFTIFQICASISTRQNSLEQYI